MKSYLYKHGTAYFFYDVHMNMSSEIGICNLGTPFPWFHISPSSWTDKQHMHQNDFFANDLTYLWMVLYACNFSTYNEIFRFHKHVCEALYSNCHRSPPWGHNGTLLVSRVRQWWRHKTVKVITRIYTVNMSSNHNHNS